MRKIAISEFKVILPNGNARYDDFHQAFMTCSANGGDMTGRSILRPINNSARRALAESYARGER